MSSNKELSISEFLNTYYLKYAIDVVENRAIPSVIDGFKPTARKIIFVANNKIWKTGKEKPLKVFQLSGYVAALSGYHHGDSSLNSAIIGLAQDFKNSMPLFDGIGQFGSLRAPSPGAPRYISVKLNNAFKLLYKDFELLNYKEEEGLEIEPEYFLPIIPTVLLNGSSGIAVGFASNIFNRNPLHLINECLNYLQDKPVNNLVPWIKGFTGKYEKDENDPNRWIIKGKIDIVNKSTVSVTELPPNITIESYDDILNKLIDKKVIVSYEDNNKDDINYEIKFRREDLEALVNTGDILSKLKILTSDKENLTVLDEFGKVKVFNSDIDIIKYFVDFRLNFYQKRKDYLLTKLSNEITLLKNKVRFIYDIIEDRLIVNKTKKSSIIEYLEKNNFDKINDSYSYLLNMSIESLTKERAESLKEDLEIKQKEYDKIFKKKIKSMYIDDLNELKDLIEKSGNLYK